MLLLESLYMNCSRVRRSAATPLSDTDCCIVWFWHSVGSQFKYLLLLTVWFCHSVGSQFGYRLVLTVMWTYIFLDWQQWRQPPSRSYLIHYSDLFWRCEWHWSTSASTENKNLCSNGWWINFESSYHYASLIMTQKCSEFHCIICPEGNTKATFIERWIVVVENRFSWPRIINNSCPLPQKLSDFHCIICPEQNTNEIFIKRSVVVVKNRFSWPRIINNSCP